MAQRWIWSGKEDAAVEENGRGVKESWVCRFLLRGERRAGIVMVGSASVEERMEEKVVCGGQCEGLYRLYS